MSCYQFVDQQGSRYPVRLLCRVLEVVPARYYAWRKETTRTHPAPEPVAWEEALEKAFTHHQKRYGTRRLRVELQEKGYRVGRQRLRTAMRQRGLRALQPRAFTPRTTDSTHGLRCAPNRLLDQPAPHGLISYGSVILPIYRWPRVPGPICAPFRTASPARWWAGRCARRCPKTWWSTPCAGHCWLVRPLPV